MRRLGLAGIATAALIALSTSSALAADGVLDPAFASGAGYRVDNFDLLTSGSGSLGEGLTLAADGSPFVTQSANDGTVEGQFTVTKFLPDGSALDPSFAAGGIRRDQVGFGSTPFSDGGQHLTLAPDGTLVVPGSAGDDSFTIQSEAAIQRYTAAGALDAPFAGGSVRHDFSPSAHSSSFSDAVVNPDGSVVAVGHDSGTRFETLIARYTAGGTLDPTFGAPDGFVRQQYGAGTDNSSWGRVVRQPDGRLLLLGQTSGSSGGITTLVARLNADGTPDPTFGAGGLVRLQLSTITPAGERKTLDGGLALAPDGSILIGGGIAYLTLGSDDERFVQAVIKLTATGALDPTFGIGGVATAQFGQDGTGVHANTDVRDLALAPDGRILIAGSANDATDQSLTMVSRLLPSGALDPTFGAGGVFLHQFGDGATPSSASYATALALGPGGTVVLTGLAGTATGRFRSLLARLVGNTAPVAAIAPVTGAMEEVPVTLDASASTDADGAITAYSWDLNGDGVFGDSTTPKPVIAFGPGPHTVSVQVTDNYGAITTATQTFSVLALPGAFKAPSTAKVSGKVASLSISCLPGGPACAGSVALSSLSGTHAKQARVKAKAKPKKPKRATNYGKATFTLAAGHHATIKVTLTPTARKAFKHHRSLRVWLLVTTKASGRQITTHRVLTLRRV